MTRGNIEIGSLTIFPFNEVTLTDLKVYDPFGEKCLEIERVGAGIGLWKFITQGKIEITYGEIIGLDADIVQKEKDLPLNIQFLIDAFASKDDNKEKKEFELALRNVVLRKSKASFRRPWIQDQKIGDLDLSDIRISDLAADIAFPKISDREIKVDLRRLSFDMPGLISVNKLGLIGEFGKDGMYMKNFILEFPNSRLRIPQVDIPLREGDNLVKKIKEDNHVLEIADSYFTPADFSFLYFPLSQFTEPLEINTIINGNIEEVTI